MSKLPQMIHNTDVYLYGSTQINPKTVSKSKKYKLEQGVIPNNHTRTPKKTQKPGGLLEKILKIGKSEIPKRG